MTIDTFRKHSLTDRMIMKINQVLEGVAQVDPHSKRPYPSKEPDPETLSNTERIASGRMMRVNHTGEVCAQALYMGQSLTTRSKDLRKHLAEAAQEECDHLHWCKTRLEELDSRPSLLNPVWYMGSFTMGAMAGLLGDQWSLGFLAETEDQVERHLERHLSALPEKDQPSRSILNQMKEDESSHAQEARDLGAVELPEVCKKAMKLASRVMTTSAKYI